MRPKNELMPGWSDAMHGAHQTRSQPMKTLFINSIVAIALLLFGHGLTSQNALGGDASGLWKGSWTSDARPSRREHGGTLNVRLRRGPGNSYRGVFSGRFAVVIPYMYRAEVYPMDGALVSSKRLRRFGTYQMILHPNANRLNGSWTASMRNGSVHTGAIQLRRR